MIKSYYKLYLLSRDKHDDKWVMGKGSSVNNPQNPSVGVCQSVLRYRPIGGMCRNGAVLVLPSSVFIRPHPIECKGVVACKGFAIVMARLLRME